MKRNNLYLKQTFILSLALSFISFAGCSDKDDKKITDEKGTEQKEKEKEKEREKGNENEKEKEPEPEPEPDPKPEPTLQEKLDALFGALESNNLFMGSIAISQDGESLYKKSAGFTDVEEGLKAHENSKYRIGSISKVFTAVLVFKAIEENRLSLDKTLKTLMPGVNIANADKITIEHLLSHRSGIANYTEIESNPYSEWHFKETEKKAMIDIIVSAGSNFTPGTKTEYSNSNFALLTYILEDAYKKRFVNILEDLITNPLVLKNTYLGKSTDTQDNESHSYTYVNAWKKAPETHISTALGAGGIVSSPADLLLFGKALFGGALISAESLEKMKTVQGIDLNLGAPLGMGLVQFDETLFGHPGTIDGFISAFMHCTASKRTIALTFNAFQGEFEDFLELAFIVASIVFD